MSPAEKAGCTQASSLLVTIQNEYLWIGNPA